MVIRASIKGDIKMYLNEKSIKDFCRRHSLTWKDRALGRACMIEEIEELIEAEVEREYEEAVDVIVTVLNYAQMSGFLHKIEKEFEEKMIVNNNKPIRRGNGKVQKTI